MKIPEATANLLSTEHRTPSNLSHATVIEHKITSSELNTLKNKIGVYIEGNNYTQNVDGYGTGFCPPTDQEWVKIANSLGSIDEINVDASLPSTVDQSKTPWFPPIGNQGSQGSCVAWSVGYYMKTFQEAQEHNWNVSAATWIKGVPGYPTQAYQSEIMSPAFIYNLQNNGLDAGLSPYNAMNLICSVGMCSWEKMPYFETNYTAWPSKDAWSEASWYRGNESGAQTISLSNDQGINSLKSWLASGHLAAITIDAYKYSNLTSTDVWTTDKYVNAILNHENTVVGYDDNIAYVENGTTHYGAFKIANSWGVGGWEQVPDGFYWISYETMKQQIGYCMFYNDIIGYKPELLAAFSINHNVRGECSIRIGLGNPKTQIATKNFNQFIYGGAYPFCQNEIVIDITEFKNYAPNLYNQSYFLSVNDNAVTNVTGTINSFSINGAQSPDAPCQTLNGNNVYLQVALSPGPSPTPVPTPAPFSWANRTWTIVDGTWSKVNDKLLGSAYYEALITADNTAYTDYAIVMNTIISSGSESSIVIRYVDQDNFYWMGLGCWGHQYTIGRTVNGVSKDLVGFGSSADVKQGVTYNLKAIAIGNTLALYVNGTQVLQTTDNSLGTGAFGIRTYGCSIQVLDISSTLNPNPLPTPVPTPAPFSWANRTWTIVDGTWSKVNDKLLGSAYYEALITADNTAYTDYAIVMNTIISSGSESSIVIRYVDQDNFYWMGLGCWGHQYTIGRTVNGVSKDLVGFGLSADVKQGVTYNLISVVNGTTLSLYVDGTQVLQTVDSSLGSGGFGIRTYGCSIQVLDAFVTPPPTPTPNPTPTLIPTPMPSPTSTPTPTPTPTPVPTATPTTTVTPTSTPTASPTSTPSPSPPPSPTTTSSPTSTPTASPTSITTATQTPIPSTSISIATPTPSQVSSASPSSTSQPPPTPLYIYAIAVLAVSAITISTIALLVKKKQ